MNDLKNILSGTRARVADGAWGTELSRRGLPPGTAPEAWNLSHPDEVREVGSAYVEAGAGIILTNTFGGSSFKLEKASLAGQVAEVNREGARISKRAAGTRALVFASIGPTGELLDPLGDLAESDAVAAFAEQAGALAAGGVDGFVIESFSDLAEAKAALRAVREVSKLPVVVSLTFAKDARGFATMMGVTPEEAARELEAAGADAVGANCGIGSAQAVEITRLMKAATALPIWIKPNAGLPKLVGGKTVFPESPEEFAANLREAVNAGASIVGGCCGSTPEHIRRLVAALA